MGHKHNGGISVDGGPGEEIASGMGGEIVGSRALRGDRFGTSAQEKKSGGARKLPALTKDAPCM